MQFEAEAVEADACKEFLDALLDELDRLSGISIDAAADVEVVPVRDCSPLRFDRRVTAPLREVLVSDALVRRRVRAAGYETSDIIGGSVGESSVVSVYVAR